MLIEPYETRVSVIIKSRMLTSILILLLKPLRGFKVCKGVVYKTTVNEKDEFIKALVNLLKFYQWNANISMKIHIELSCCVKIIFEKLKMMSCTRYVSFYWCMEIVLYYFDTTLLSVFYFSSLRSSRFTIPLTSISCVQLIKLFTCMVTSLVYWLMLYRMV